VGAQLRADEWQGSARAQLVVERVAPIQADSDEGVGDRRPEFSKAYAESKDDGGVPFRPGWAGVEGMGHARWPASARDLRGHPGRVSTLAQVLGTQESAVLFTASVAKTIELLRSRLPSGLFCGAGVVCVDRAFVQTGGEEVSTSRLAIIEWDAAAEMRHVLLGRVHAVVFDPPYRVSHVGSVFELSDAGSSVHLLHGNVERKETAVHLRYVVHPRFAMVCLYKAMQAREEDDAELTSAARLIAWQEARVVLTRQDLLRAECILRELGLEHMAMGKAKLDARENAMYREAEAEYEECARLCLTL
jgi:hypothetical protein